MSEADGVNLGYVTGNHINMLMDYSIWADDNRMQPPLPWLVQNRHSWVFNDTPIPFCDNYGPDSLEYFTNEAKTNFNNYNTEAAYASIAKGLHYIEDLGNPFHTSSLYAQERHLDYENWAVSHWSALDSATTTDQYYIIMDPSEDSKYLAGMAYQQLAPIYTIIGSPGWENSQELIDRTRELITQSEMMTMGMHVYASKFESPNTVGSNGVPIYDYQTSYAYIDNVACSYNMFLPITIEHTYISDLEIWIGWKDDGSSTYTEYKIWDRQGGDADGLSLIVQAQGFQNIHDWRLRVVDSAGGDEGVLTEFYDLIG